MCALSTQASWIKMDEKGVKSLVSPFAGRGVWAVRVFEQHLFRPSVTAMTLGRASLCDAHAIGRKLAQELHCDAVVVVQFPDSGVMAALGFSHASASHSSGIH
jgi:hypothetical protein